MRDALTTPAAFLALTLIAFTIGQWINQKTGSPLANPLLIGCVIVGAVLVIFQIPLDEYNEGGGFFTLCLTPASQIHRIL